MNVETNPEAPAAAAAAAATASRSKLFATLAKPMTTLSQEEVNRYHELASQTESRIYWAPAIANGSAILALAGIVGNVSSPDTALSALTGPLAIFSTGLALGIISIALSAEAYSVVANTQKAQNQIKADLVDLFRDFFAAMDGLTAENAAVKVEEAKPLTAAAKSIQERQQELSNRLSQTRFQVNLLQYFNRAALVSVAVGFLYLLVGHGVGWIKLEANAFQGKVIASDKQSTPHPEPARSHSMARSVLSTP